MESCLASNQENRGFNSLREYQFNIMRIGFHKGSNLINKLILFFSRGGYSHCGIILNDNSTIEAKPFKNVYHKKNYLLNNGKNVIIDVYDVKTTPKQDKIIIDYLASQIGKKYDYLAVFGFVFYINDDKRNKFICSELVYNAFKAANINLLDRVVGYKISPTVLSYNTKMKFVERIKT